MNRLKVLLVDDHAILREGLRALLSHYEEIEVIGEAQDGLAAIIFIEDTKPDIVIMDIAMPGMCGIEATRLIHEKFPEVRVLILSQHDDWQYVKPLLEAGAAGYLTKRALGKDLITALQTVARGETFLQPSIATTVTKQMRGNSKKEDRRVEHLTDREQEILKLIASGKTNPQIAIVLSLSVKTVDWHRTNLMSKLDIHGVADLVRFAIQNGYAD